MNFAEVKNVLDQLPISYYLKRKAKATLSETEPMSFIDLGTSDIVISYNQVVENLTDDLEESLRHNLYHEVSHAMLSPRPRLLTIDKDELNIFEDERIECLLEGYYLDVNFKSFLLRNNQDFKITDPMSAFFYCVRLRGGGVHINREIDSLIIKWKNLHFSIEPQNLLAYQKDIHNLFLLIQHRFKTNQIETMTPSSYKPIVLGGEGEQTGLIMKALEHLQSYNDREFGRQLELIINSRLSERANNSNSKKTYSGRINPKAINKPDDDYKWFTKKGDGFLNKYKGIKINLFIDQSGSFVSNEHKVNCMLKELSYLERKIEDFRYDLITIDTEIRLAPKNKKYIICQGGNCISPRTEQVFKSVQTNNYKIINIILFNGCAATDRYNSIIPEAQWVYSKAFNTYNTIIISDNSNRDYLEHYCSRAKRIYTKNYVEDLRDNILKSLKILIQ